MAGLAQQRLSDAAHDLRRRVLDAGAELFRVDPSPEEAGEIVAQVLRELARAELGDAGESGDFLVAIREDLERGGY